MSDELLSGSARRLAEELEDDGVKLEEDDRVRQLLLDELDYGGATVATAVNQSFVRAVDRPATALKDGDAVEILTPRQGG